MSVATFNPPCFGTRYCVVTSFARGHNNVFDSAINPNNVIPDNFLGGGNTADKVNEYFVFFDRKFRGIHHSVRVAPRKPFGNSEKEFLALVAL